MAAGSSDYLIQSESSVECATNNYSVDWVDEGYSDWLNIGANTGEIKAKEQAAEFKYKIKVCVQNNNFDCLSSPTLSLTINIRCSPLIHFLNNEGLETLLKGTPGSYLTAFRDHTLYAASADPINCPLASFDLLVLIGNHSAIAMTDHGSGQVKVWASGGQFEITLKACSKHLASANIDYDCAVSGTYRIKTEEIEVNLPSFGGNSSTGSGGTA